MMHIFSYNLRFTVFILLAVVFLLCIVSFYLVISYFCSLPECPLHYFRKFCIFFYLTLCCIFSMNFASCSVSKISIFPYSERTHQGINETMRKVLISNGLLLCFQLIFIIFQNSLDRLKEDI